MYERASLRASLHSVIITYLKSTYLDALTQQTSGGLLASVPADRAQLAINELRLSGYSDAAIIGKVIEREKRSEYAALIDLRLTQSN